MGGSERSYGQSKKGSDSVRGREGCCVRKGLSGLPYSGVKDFDVSIEGALSFRFVGDAGAIGCE